MKRLPLIALLLATPALADTSMTAPPSGGHIAPNGECAVLLPRPMIPAKDEGQEFAHVWIKNIPINGISGDGDCIIIPERLRSKVEKFQ